MTAPNIINHGAFNAGATAVNSYNSGATVTVSAGHGRYLAVGLPKRELNAAGSYSAVTWTPPGGSAQALALLDKQDSDLQASIEVWGVAAPTVGTNGQIDVTLTGTAIQMCAMWVQLDTVNPTSPVASTPKAGGGSAQTATVSSITSTANQTVLGFFTKVNSTESPMVAGQTLLDTSASTAAAAASNEIGLSEWAAGGATSMSATWSPNNRRWAGVCLVMDGVTVVLGTGAVALPHLTLAATGTEKIAGTGAVALPHLVLAATGRESITGIGAVALPHLLLAGTGTQTAPSTTQTGGYVRRPIVQPAKPPLFDFDLDDEEILLLMQSRRFH